MSIKCHYCLRAIAIGENHRCGAVGLSDFPDLQMTIRPFRLEGGVAFVVAMDRKVVEELGIEWGTETARAAVGGIQGREAGVELIQPNEIGGEKFTRLRWLCKPIGGWLTEERTNGR